MDFGVHIELDLLVNNSRTYFFRLKFQKINLCHTDFRS